MTDLKRTDQQFTDETTFVREVTPRRTSYRDGYVQGQQSEQYRLHQQYQNQKTREDQSLSVGLLIGILLTGSAVFGVGAFFLFNQQQTPSPVAAPTAAPEVQTSPSPPASPSSNKETTIIERTVEKAREVLPAVPSPVEVPKNSPASPGTPGTLGEQSQNTQTRQDNPAPAGNTATPDATKIPKSAGP
jgi:cytoskeletal protein RodZ